jgi:hypothetical protein
MSERRTESLLRELPRNLEPVRPMPRLRTLVVAAVAAFALTLAIDGLLGHPLPLVAGGVAWADGGFLTLLAGLLLTAAGAILAALAGAVPGRERAAAAGWRVAVAGVAVAASAGCWALLGFAGADSEGALDLGFECAGRASLLGVVPALVLCVFLARAFERRPLLGAGAAAVGALALGAAAVHASCANGGVLHMLLGHWLTPFAAALLLAAPLSLGVSRLSRRS